MFDIIEAIALVQKIGINATARQLGLNRATLASRIKAYDKRLAPAEPKPLEVSGREIELEAEPEPYRFVAIRRNEDHTRQQLGLPPLTNEEWAVEKSKLEECERQMRKLLWNSNDS